MKSGQNQEQLIVFTRYPEPGTTKTRLAGILGEIGAAEFQKRLADLVLSQVRCFMEVRPADVFIYYHGGGINLMREWLGPDFNYREQSGADLGNRMENAFATAFKLNYKRIVIIGTDCPGLRTGHIEQAFALLQHKDLVLGPAADGGYYLIGLSRFEKYLFSKVPWGTDSVLTTTITRAGQKGLSLALLETLSDVDRPEDLELLTPSPENPGE